MSSIAGGGVGRSNAVRVRWKPCVWARLTRFPAIDPFARVSQPADRAALTALESWTEPGSGLLRDDPAASDAGDPLDDDGPDPILAAFAAIPALGAWLGDRTNGLFFAAGDRATALAEAKHRIERFLREAAAPPLHIDARVMEATLDGQFQDLRRRATGPATGAINGSPTLRLVRTARARGYDGLVYDSSRHRGGECVAVFRPAALADRRPAETIGLLWDGERIAAVYEKRPYAVEV